MGGVASGWTALALRPVNSSQCCRAGHSAASPSTHHRAFSFTLLCSLPCVRWWVFDARILWGCVRLWVYPATHAPVDDHARGSRPMPGIIVTSSAHEPQTTAVRSRVGIVSAGVDDAISEAKTAVAAAAPQTTIDGDGTGTAETPHPR